MSFEFEKPLQVKATNIPGLIVFDLPVHGDSRGWFKENWQREKMLELGLPDFSPVQNNISYNAHRGVTRGVHAEPWDKFISVAMGAIFGAWVDLREGDSFGQVFTCELNPSKAIFVPRGVGNSFQALQDDTVYTYLVNDHWSADLKSSYTFVNLADPDLCIDWPIPLSEAKISNADLHHPFLSLVEPMPPKKVLVVVSKDSLLCRCLATLKDECLSHFDVIELPTDRPGIDPDFNEIDFKRYSAVVNSLNLEMPDREVAGNAWPLFLNYLSASTYIARQCTTYNLLLIHLVHEESSLDCIYKYDGCLKADGFHDLVSMICSNISSACPRNYVVPIPLSRVPHSDFDINYDGGINDILCGEGLYSSYCCSSEASNSLKNFLYMLIELESMNLPFGYIDYPLPS